MPTPTHQVEIPRRWTTFQNATGARLFTLEQANRTLPLVRRIARDVMGLARSVRHLRFHHKFVARGGEELERLFPSELRRLRARLARDEERFSECVNELLNLGVELEAPSLGLVDFPAIVAGEPLCFCWRYDEPEIGWWHHRTGGYVDRRPLAELERSGQPPAIAARRKGSPFSSSFA